MSAVSDAVMADMLKTARTYALVLLRRGPAYIAPDQRPPQQAKIVWEHGRRNFELRAAGKMALVGPVSGGEIVGLSVFATGIEEAAAIMAADPAVLAGILEVEVQPWVSFPGDSLPR